MTIKCRKIQSFDVQLQSVGWDVKVLIVSDTHFGCRGPIKNEIEKFVCRLQFIQDEHHPTMIFILGDTFHYSYSSATTYWSRLLNCLEKVKIDVHIIPGNHERKHFEYVKAIQTPPNVHIHDVEIIRLVRNQNVLLVGGHDLRNDNKAHGSKRITEWVNALRREFANKIPPNAFVVLGHTHENFMLTNCNASTIGQFSPAVKKYNFMIVEVHEDTVGVVSYEQQKHVGRRPPDQEELLPYPDQNANPRPERSVQQDPNFSKQYRHKGQYHQPQDRQVQGRKRSPEIQANQRNSLHRGNEQPQPRPIRQDVAGKRNNAPVNRPQKRSSSVRIHRNSGTRNRHHPNP